MVKIKPFSALRYSGKKVSLKKVVCPPYDVINRRQRKGYIKESPHNIVRLVLPESRDGIRDYRRAKRDLDIWMKKGILEPDKEPSIYVYLQEYRVGKKKIGRLGFLCLLKLESKGNSGVLPHENVFSKPLLDRVELMKKTKSHLSPIFIVFKDQRAKAAKMLSAVARRIPDADIYADGARHKLWQFSDKKLIEKLRKHVNASQTFIADGHHRFRASMATMDHFNKKRAKSDGHKHTLVYLVSSEDKGLKILPTYRAVKVLPKGFSIEYIHKKLERYFTIKTISAGKVDRCLKHAFDKKKCAFVVYYKKKYLLLTLNNSCVIKDVGPKTGSLRWKRLDVSILHNLLFAKLLGIKENIAKERNIYYYKGAHELIRQVDSGNQRMGVFLNPSTMKDVVKLAKQGEKMPHKSTYFFPKPLTGLVIHKF